MTRGTDDELMIIQSISYKENEVIPDTRNA